jgi:hypothetical protein
MSFQCRFIRVALLCAPLAAGPIEQAAAQPGPGSDEPNLLEVPGGDIFGFTSPSDVGSPGDRGIAFELSNRAGKRGGHYWSPTLKTQFSYTADENVAIALSPWATAHQIENVPALDDRTSTRFDGFSGEVSYRFLQRTPTNPYAATLSMEPRVARVDAVTGEHVRAYGNEVKLFVDAVLVPGRLYGAVNFNYAFGAQQGFEAGEKWAESSGTNVSAALTYQFTKRLFAGVEGRYLTSFSGALLNEQMGWGVFAGPTMLVKVTDSAALNVVWTPQLTGRSAGSGGALDLDNFERQQFRAKLATSF